MAADNYTNDEKLINKAGSELQLMLETSPYSPLECLRRVFVPVLEKVRAEAKAAGVSPAGGPLPVDGLE